ncbi:GPP34 family phosphoprotein [Streptomyces sp. ALI-76-A]|uniref:GOLPH3/VPS74 family protein n=1 Tax=Streptomyces sp. ALI-76-A TaxID=3025736 RepID=UPI00256EA491|nr:GPP34 family phosphoprotein [Streptomyces sp. ALI-76-A]MDL5204911.1 GPP34 family phosphoprotein [Streptomyces sp. ALI-76-A]
MPHGSLSLPARLCLLAWNSTETETGGAGRLPPLVRAGALVELAQRGLLIDDDGIATPADLDSGTGDAVLDGLLELVRESRPHRWRTWVTLRARITLDAVREQLAAEGHLRAEKRRVLGVFPTVEYALDRGAVLEALCERTREAVGGPFPVAELSERDAAVAALADAAGLVPGAGPVPGRLEELTERGGAATAVLRTVLREVRTTRVASAVAD